MVENSAVLTVVWWDCIEAEPWVSVVVANSNSIWLSR